jgi:hypothetical protein
VAASSEVLDFIAKRMSPPTYVNLTDQYYPWYLADDSAPLDRPLRRGKYSRVIEISERQGLRRLDEHREQRPAGNLSACSQSVNLTRQGIAASPTTSGLERFSVSAVSRIGSD